MRSSKVYFWWCSNEKKQIAKFHWNVKLNNGEVKLRARSYFTNGRDVAKFLEIFDTWWTIWNSKKRFSPNLLGNAVISGERETEF